MTNSPPDEIERVARNWLHDGEHDFGFYESQSASYETRVALRAYVTRLREQIAAKDAEIARLKEKRRMKIVPAPPIVFEDDTP